MGRFLVLGILATLRRELGTGKESLLPGFEFSSPGAKMSAVRNFIDLKGRQGARAGSAYVLVFANEVDVVATDEGRKT